MTGEPIAFRPDPAELAEIIERHAKELDRTPSYIINMTLRRAFEGELAQMGHAIYDVYGKQSRA